MNDELPDGRPVDDQMDTTYTLTVSQREWEILEEGLDERESARLRLAYQLKAQGYDDTAAVLRSNDVVNHSLRDRLIQDIAQQQQAHLSDKETREEQTHE